MFCKKCGHQNPDDAKFCMSCGFGITFTNEKEETDKTRRLSIAPIRHQFHGFQKILLLISLSWFVVALFYIPYKEDDETIYDVVWSDRGAKIDSLKVFLQFGFLFVITFAVYKYLSRFDNLAKNQYKKLVKREIYLFFIFLSCTTICGIYLFGSNFFNKRREQRISKQIAPLEQKINKNLIKRKIRSAYWAEAKTIYHLGEFGSNVNTYWSYLVLNMQDINWLFSYYNSFNKRDKELVVENSRLKYNWNEYNSLNKEFGLNTPFKLQTFIKQNAFNDDDRKNDEENKILSITLNKLQEEKSQLIFFDNIDIRQISLLTFMVVFAILYLLRPLFWFIKGLFSEIK